MSAPHQATPTAGAQSDPVDLRSSVFQILKGKGLTDNQALGILYSMMGESGTGLNPNSLGDSGQSIGFGQWNGSRRVALEKIAAGMGTGPTDPSAQLAHFKAEIDGPYAAEIERVRNNATTTADATKLWTGSTAEGIGYERPAKNNWAQRYGQGTRAASIDPKTGALTFTAAPAATVAAGGVTTPGAGAPAAPTTSGAQDFATAAKAGNVGGALAALTKGKEEGGKGPLGSLADQVGKAAPALSSSSPMLTPVDTGQGAQAQAGQQLLGQVLQQGAKPLSWSTQPYGYGAAGPQIPGTTLNSMGT
jgi:hypothetical protein